MDIIDDQDFRSWEAGAPSELRSDPIWRLHAHRVALYLLDLTQVDVRELRARHADREQVDQLLRAVASISANLAEGLGRATPADRSRFLGIAIGSLRESVIWYRALRDNLSPDVLERRFDQLSQLRRLLIGSQRWLATKPDRRSLF